MEKSKNMSENERVGLEAIGIAYTIRSVSLRLARELERRGAGEDAEYYAALAVAMDRYMDEKSGEVVDGMRS